MKLVPVNAPLAGVTFETAIYPGKTYAMNLETGRIGGWVDGREALSQAAYKALHTVRGRYPVYSNNYGAELEDKLGMPVGLALPEIKRCITEALTWDSRVLSVDGFLFDVRGSSVHVQCTLHSIYGDLDVETEVTI